MNFVQSSVEAFRSSKTSTLAQLVYINLLCGVTAVALAAFNIPSMVGPSLLVPVYFVSFVFVLATPFLLGFFIRRMSNFTAYGLYYGYAVALGTVISPRLTYYGGTKVAVAALLTGFGFLVSIALERFAPTSTKTLYRCSILLIGLTILNLFMRLSILELGICSLGVATCIGYTGYLMGNLDRFSAYQGVQTHRLAILISLSLLQNLITLFIYILRFLDLLGNKRKN